MSELARDADWQRLDARMLLVHPVREVLRFLPFVVVAFFAGSARDEDGPLWHVLSLAVPVALGLLRYLTTTFRVDADRVELRRGLLSRHTLSTPTDRVRTVDLTSSPIHRLLGLTTVRVGTGSASGDDDEQIDLDGLPLARARELRAELLRVTPGSAGEASAAPGQPRDGVPVLRLDPAWVRFAPLTSSGVVIAAAALGLLLQLVNQLGPAHRVDPRSVTRAADTASWWVVGPLVAVGLVAAVSVLAVVGYLLTNHGLLLSRVDAPGGSTWHLRRGLLTTRETSLDDDRVAGVTLAEPLALRLAGGARLVAVVTGLNRRQRTAAVLVPPAPRDVSVGVAAAVLGTPDPMTAPLLGHGPRAVRRRWVRALLPALVVSVVAAGSVVAGSPAWWLLALVSLPAGALLAADRCRALGHTLVAGHVVSRSGSLDRRREALAVEHVIGWTLRATWFQRRAGLVTVVATTAGGRQQVRFPDLPHDAALVLVGRAMPDLLAAFVA